MQIASHRGRSPRGESNLMPSRHGEEIRCVFCSGQQFRRSRLRTDDIQRLLRLLYPGRCLRCGERQWHSFTVAALARPSSAPHIHPARAVSIEKNWTEPSERMVLRDIGNDDPSL